MDDIDYVIQHVYPENEKIFKVLVPTEPTLGSLECIPNDIEYCENCPYIEQCNLNH